MKTYLLPFLIWMVQGFAAFHLTWNIPAVNLDSNPPFGDSDENAKVVIDPFGNALATWSRTTSNQASEDIWVAIYNHSARVWAGATKISGGGSASNPAIAVDKEGNAIVVWEEGFPSEIKSRTLSPSGVWSPPLALPPASLSSSKKAQTNPQIAIDGKRNAVAIWMESSGDNSQIHSAKLVYGMKWKPLGPVSGLGAEFHLSSPLALNDAGLGIAVWRENGSEVHGARYYGGQWLPSFLVSSVFGEKVESPCAGIDSQGNAVIVWNQIGSRQTIQSKTLKNDILSDLLTVSNPEWAAQRPCIGVDEKGNGVVVYERYDAAFSSSAQAKFIAGSFLQFGESRWSVPQDISGPSFDPNKTPSAGFPVLSMNSIGDGVVIWKEYNGENTIVQGSGFSLGTWGLFKTLSMIGDNSGALFPKYDIGVAVNLAGSIVAVWPEDSSGNRTHQIKAATGVGIALEGPLPPHLVAAFSALSAPSVADLNNNKLLAGFIPPPLAAIVRNVEGASSGIAYGVQVLHRFAGHGDLINILNWGSAGNVSYYKVYRENLSTLIGTTKTTKFEDHQRVPKKRVVYLVTAVGSNEQESGPLTIIVDPL